MEDPTIQIERIEFFGWVWEPYHSLIVTGSSRDDKAGIDITISAFGDDTTEMEICKICYYKVSTLMLEATIIFGSYPLVEK